MTGWLLLSDRDHPLTGHSGRIAVGTLVMEFAWPLPTGVLLDWRGDDRALSMFHHPQSGLGLYWREGPHLHRHLLSGALRSDARLARLTFHWDAPGNLWRMRLDGSDGAEIVATCGLAPAALPLRALEEMAAGHGVNRRDGAVLWFGVLTGESPPARAPWIGRATPVPTPGGPVPAGTLRRGEWVLTRDAGPVQLRDVRHLDMPSRGSHAAVQLRAPFHARGRDLLVSADQMVALDGPETEYLFGEDEVLVSAGALIDGRTAIADNRRAVTTGVSLDLGALHLIDAGGCVLMTAHHATEGPMPIMPLRAIRDYEAAPLMSLLRRLRPSDAA